MGRGLNICDGGWEIWNFGGGDLNMGRGLNM